MTEKMTDAFRKIEGGLFTTVTKADVGGAVGSLREAGVELMCWADPFYPAPSTPEHVIQATVDSIKSGVASHYTMPIGNPELKLMIARHLKRFNSLEVEPLRNILVTPGSDAGLFFAMIPFINRGDEVMVIDPSYPNNFMNVEILGGKVIRIPAYAANGFHPPLSEFEKRVSRDTKMLVLTNPNNPTTTVYRKPWLQEIADFAIAHDLVVVVDQAFEFPVFDDYEMVTLASLPGMWNRTLTVCSLSKGMGLSGFRVGYIVADDVIMDKLYGSAVSVIGAANTAAQIGAIAALRNTDYLEEYRRIHLNRRDLVFERLSDIPGTCFEKPQSGFLTWMNVSGLGGADEIVSYLIKEAGVAVNSGLPYGMQGEGHIRIVHGVMGGMSELDDALIRIRKALLKLAGLRGLA